MSNTTKRNLDPAIRRVRLQQFTIFDITEHELEELERGSPDSIFLNIGVAALSAGASFGTSLATTDIKSIFTFSVFVIFTVVSLLASLVLLLLWWRSRGTTASVAAKIRSRVAPDGLQESCVEEQTA